MSLTIVPCTLTDACAFVEQHHRHHAGLETNSTTCAGTAHA